ncbi:MAG: DUF427 domain-containing protein [Acidimicrobiales bacterium]
MTDARGQVRVEDGPKRVRAYKGGQLIADTTRVKLVWEAPYYPTYYFPASDVRLELLTPTGRTAHSPSRGDAQVLSLVAGGSDAPDAALRYSHSPIDTISEHLRFDWDAMDEWLEEDEPVYTHARSPYVRVDILASSRHVEVLVGGVTVADSRQPWLLFETGLPTRYYLPLSDVRLDLLRPSTTTTRCPYKGTAAYWSVDAGGTVLTDAVWIYRTPLPESQKIAGLAAFFNERFDIRVDGELLERPSTVFS